jgi:hypothetical protein
MPDTIREIEQSVSSHASNIPRQQNQIISTEELNLFLHSCSNLSKTLPSTASVKMDSVLNLERADEHFHKHSFVKHLQKRLELSMGPLLDSLLNGLVNPGIGLFAFLPSNINKK